jgi:transposase-like protein
MLQDKVKKDYTIQVSDSFDRMDEQCRYEPAFRRWLVREIEEQKMTVADAIERFNFHPKNGFELVRSWREKYAPSMVLSLPDMTVAEKQQLAGLQQQLKAAEKQLEDAKMTNIALNMLIDVAEEKLKIHIRKKPGAKQ